MVSQTNQINACVKEMEKELESLRKETTFREFVGYEMALNHIKKRFERIINPNT